MKELIFDNATKGFPFRMDDIDLMQTNTKYLISQLTRGLGFNDSTLVVSGCNISVNNPGLVDASFNIYPGIIFHNDELYYVDQVLTQSAPYATVATIESTYFWDEYVENTFPRIYKNGDTEYTWRYHKAILTLTPSTWSNISPDNTYRLIDRVNEQVIPIVTASTEVKDAMALSTIDEKFSEYNVRVKDLYNDIVFNNNQTDSFEINGGGSFFIHKVTGKVKFYFQFNKKTASDYIFLRLNTPESFTDTLWYKFIDFKLGGTIYTGAVIKTTAVTESYTDIEIKLNTALTGSMDIFYSGDMGYIT
jgi:hypothetical protein